MLVQIISTLVHIVTVTPVHTAPIAPVAPTVTTVSTAVGNTIDKGFEVLTLKPWWGAPYNGTDPDLSRGHCFEAEVPEVGSHSERLRCHIPTPARVADVTM